jgi:hypothetical protein
MEKRLYLEIASTKAPWPVRRTISISWLSVCWVGVQLSIDRESTRTRQVNKAYKPARLT